MVVLRGGGDYERGTLYTLWKHTARSAFCSHRRQLYLGSKMYTVLWSDGRAVTYVEGARSSNALPLSDGGLALSYLVGVCTPV